jgi:hypothetical protein
MRLSPVILVSLVALVLGPLNAAAGGVDLSAPIVVELFTSQACSTCPPADAYLGQLAKRPDVLALGFHVDYWDYTGWKDPYGARFATERQRQYEKFFGLPYVYTPQMVVNGVSQGVGTDHDQIEDLLKQAAAATSAHPSLAIDRTADGGLIIHIGAAPSAKPATVWLAGFDRQQVTEVGGGENNGRILTGYQVVRRLDSLGTWTGAALDLPVPAASIGDYLTPDRGLAVLVQSEGVGPVLAAQSLPHAPNTESLENSHRNP